MAAACTPFPGDCNSVCGNKLDSAANQAEYVSTCVASRTGYQWQAKYRWRPEFEFGLQGFGDVGKWNDWDAHDVQMHTLGPAIFGKFPLGGAHVFKYNAAVLFKASSAAPDRTLRAQLEYEF